MYYLHRLIGLPASVAWALIPATAYAQEAGSPPSLTSDEIVVTAQRRSERLKDVPISVSVATGAALQQGNLRNLEEISVRLPNVKIATAPVSDFITIRGVGSSLNLGFEQSVATFVDGVYRGRSRATRAALFDIERVEVLKGPQTTFFGNNAIAGALNITTRKPGRNAEGNATVFFAPDTDEYSIEAGVTIPVTGDLSIRAAGRASGMDGYITNVNLGRDGPNLDDQIGRVSIAWTPASNIETNARIDIGRNRDRDIFSPEALNCPPVDPVFGSARGACARYLAGSGGTVDDRLDGISAASPSFFEYDFLEAAQTTAFGVGDNSLIFTTGYFEHEYDLLNDVGTVPARFGSVVGTTQVQPARFLEEFRQISQEVRFQSPTEGRFSYMIGAYFADTHLKLDTIAGFFNVPVGALSGGVFAPTTPIAVRVRNEEDSRTISVFAATTFKITTSLKLNVGARYSAVKKEASRIAEVGSAASVPGPDNFNASVLGTTTLAPALGVDQGDFADPDRTDKKFMPTAGLQYDVTDDVMTYMSYTKGFKAGGFSAFISKSDFDPETVDAFEVGVKASVFQGLVAFNLALFRSKYSDLQETTTIPLSSGGTAQIVGNVAESTSEGVELGLTLRPAMGLVLTADLAYLDARYDSYPDAPCTTRQSALTPVNCTQDLSGKRRAFAPKYSGNIGGTYEAAIWNDLEVRLNANLYFSSRFFQQPLADRNLEQRGYAKIDARIGVGPSDGRWELAIVGKNLTNKITGSFRQPLASSPGGFQALADPLRTIGFQGSVRF